MRLAVVADTHGRPLPAAAAARLRDADLILHAGDLSTAAALEAVRALGPPVVAVAGNVDGPDVDLPETQVVEAGGARIGLLHDAGPAKGRLERLRARFPGCAAVVFGHSHIPLVERDGDFQIFNPGSATQRRRQPRHTMGEAEVRDGRVTFRHITLG